MCKPQILPGKDHIAHGVCSVFQKIVIPRAPGLSYGWRLLELQRAGARVSRRVRAGAGPGDGVREAVHCHPCCKDIPAAGSTLGM